VPPRKQVAFVLLAAIAMVQCHRQSAPPAESGNNTASTPPVRDSVPASLGATSGDDALSTFMTRASWFGETRASVTGVFGPPNQVLRHNFNNPDDTTIVDTAVALVYDSARFDFYIRTADHTDIFSTADISAPRYLRGAQIQLGATVSAVRRLFGDTITDSTSHLVYSCNECPVSSTHAEFWFLEGRLTRVLWQHGID